MGVPSLGSPSFSQGSDLTTSAAAANEAVLNFSSAMESILTRDQPLPVAALRRDLQEMLADLRRPPETSHGRRKIYVYSLAVEYPKGSKEASWRPKDWNKSYGFQWPKIRTYLSEGAAQRRAELLREYGAVVRVLRSRPVTWDADG